MRNETTRMLRDLVIAMEARATLAATAPVLGQAPAATAPAHGQAPAATAPAHGQAPAATAPAHGQE